MFFLIPLAFSLFSAGAGIYSQVQQNNQLAAESAESLASQQEQNKYDLIHQSIAYSQAIDEKNEQKAALDQQAKLDQAKTKQRITAALLGTAAFMLVLSIVALATRKETP